MAKSSIHARRQARRALVQALYQWHMSGADYLDVRRDFEAGDSLKRADTSFFNESLRRVAEDVEALDGLIAPLLDRKLTDLDHVELAILRLGTDELRSRIDVPYKVVIDEYVELAKVFGAEESHKYVNGVLDKLARQLRTLETAAR